MIYGMHKQGLVHPVHSLCTPCALPVHSLCTAYALPVHLFCTRCTLCSLVQPLCTQLCFTVNIKRAVLAKNQMLEMKCLSCCAPKKSISISILNPPTSFKMWVRKEALENIYFTLIVHSNSCYRAKFQGAQGL